MFLAQLESAEFLKRLHGNTSTCGWLRARLKSLKPRRGAVLRPDTLKDGSLLIIL
jgi:hypothetical protein